MKMICRVNTEIQLLRVKTSDIKSTQRLRATNNRRLKSIMSNQVCTI